MENWMTVIFSSIIATLISAGTLIHSVIKHNKDSIVNSITLNRIEWIGQVRDLVSQFLCAYIDKESESDLRKKALKVELMTRNKSGINDYSPMLKSLKACCEDASLDYNTDSMEANVEQMVLSTQYVLSRVWTRIKLVGGQNKKKDNKIREKVNDLCGTFEDYITKCK